jgi:hypothetical protein
MTATFAIRGKEYRKIMSSARAGLCGGQFGGVLEGGSDKKDILMTSPASLVTLVDFFE